MYIASPASWSSLKTELEGIQSTRRLDNEWTLNPLDENIRDEENRRLGSNIKYIPQI